MGNVKPKFRGESVREDLTEGINAMNKTQFAEALSNKDV